MANNQNKNAGKIANAAAAQNAKSTNAKDSDSAQKTADTNPPADTDTAQAPANTATVKVNGGEPISLFSDEGQASLRKLIDEAVAKGEKPTVQINDGETYDYDAPELEAEFTRLRGTVEFGADESVKAVSKETQAAADKGKEPKEPPAGKVKANKDSTTISREVEGEIKTEILPRSAENPNERFTESVGKPRIDANAAKTSAE